MPSLANSHDSRLSLLKVPGAKAAHADEMPYLRGVRDFLEIDVTGRTHPVAAPRLVRAFLRLCRRGGMKPKHVEALLGYKEGARIQAWSRYFNQRRPMGIGTFRKLVARAIEAGWLHEQRTLPASTNPRHRAWGEDLSASDMLEWECYWQPQVAEVLEQRLCAIEACMQLRSQGAAIDLNNVLDQIDEWGLYGLYKKQIRTANARRFAQKVRRAKEAHGECYWMAIGLDGFPWSPSQTEVLRIDD